MSNPVIRGPSFRLAPASNNITKIDYITYTADIIFEDFIFRKEFTSLVHSLPLPTEEKKGLDFVLKLASSSFPEFFF